MSTIKAIDTQETRTPLPVDPGREARVDYEYERTGVASLFMLFARLDNWCHVSVRERRTAIDCPNPAGPGRCAFPIDRQDHARAEQSQHPQTSLIVQ